MRSGQARVPQPGPPGVLRLAGHGTRSCGPRGLGDQGRRGAGVPNEGGVWELRHSSALPDPYQTPTPRSGPHAVRHVGMCRGGPGGVGAWRLVGHGLLSLVLGGLCAPGSDPDLLAARTPA